MNCVKEPRNDKTYYEHGEVRDEINIEAENIPLMYVYLLYGAAIVLKNTVMLSRISSI